MNKITKKLLLTAFLVFLCLSYGCMFSPTTTEDINEATDTSSDLPVTSFPDPLTGTRWQLLSFANTEASPRIPEELHIIVWFDKGGIGYKGGCNSVSGYYHLDNEKITTSVREMTLVDCSDDYLGSEKMEIDSEFYNSMESFREFALNDSANELRIFYEDGELLLHKARE